MMVVESRLPAAAKRRTSPTRKALLNAGQALFARQPMDSVTIDQIVDAAEVAKGSFYNYFADKGTLAREILELVHGDMEFKIFSINHDVTDPAERVARAVCAVVLYAIEHPDRIRAMTNLAARGTKETSPLNAGARADVRNGIEQGRFVEIDVETGILAIIGLTNIAIDHMMFEALAEQDIFRLAQTSATSVLRALGLGVEMSGRVAAQAARSILKDVK